MEKKCPGRRDIFWFLFNPGKRDIFVTSLKLREKYWFLILNKDDYCESENQCSGNSYDSFINVFVDWPHVWFIASLENENEADWK